LKTFLWRHIDRILIAAGFVHLMVILGATIRNLTRMYAVEVPEEVRLPGGSFTALYTLNAGMNKPALLNRYGDALVEFSGWNSYVTVDGVTADLWSHAFGIELDRSGNRAYLTWSSIPLQQSNSQSRQVRRYQITQIVSLKGDQAFVDYYIIPNESLERAQLTVGLFKWYYQDFTASTDQFSFLSSDLDRPQAEERLRSRRLTHVTVLSQTPPQSQRVLANDFGTYGLELSYAIPRPKPYERTRLAGFRISLGKEGAPANP
jgi:hypothetical protein